MTDADTAELIKYVSNAFLATKIAFANEMANLAERLHLDIDQVMPAVGLDPRIGPAFLESGLGFGGSCFPKDLSALQYLATKNDAPSSILAAVLAHNDVQPLRAVQLAEKALGTLTGKRVALLGLAFKPGTSDVRESRALPIHHALVAAGADVVCYDPVANESFAALFETPPSLAYSAEEAVAEADALILQTAWPEFAALDPIDLKQAMRTPVVIDGRRALDARRHRAAGILYHAIGNGTGEFDESSDPRGRPRNEVPARH